MKEVLENSLNSYKNTINHIIKKINSIYGVVTFTTIDEILKNEIDLRTIYWQIEKLYDEQWASYKIIESQLENLSEEDFDDFGYEIEVEVDDTKRLVENKITSLQSLIDYLEKIEELEEEEDLVKYFSDIKQINL
jgi:hypothetical protein